MKPSIKKLKTFGVNVGIVLVTVVGMGFLGEVSLRAMVYFENQKGFERLLTNLPQPQNGTASHLGQMIQPSRYNKIIYELRPNLSVRYMNALVKTNEQGFRNEPFPIRKDKNTARIIALGDSHMFGWGVSQDKIYTKVLEAMLNARFPQQKWEVINTAVPGYNTFMEIETLDKKALMYDPDIVIMEYIGNDLDLPNFIIDAVDYLTLRRSFLCDFLRKRLNLLKINFSLVDAPMQEKPLASDIPWQFENNPDKVPRRYRDMVGDSAIVSSMKKLKDMQEENHFQVIICVSQNWPPYISELIKRLSKELRFHVLVDFQKIEPSLVLDMQDTHPNALAHTLKAQGLLDFMVREKIIGNETAGTR